MHRYLITGASGFVAQHFLRHLGSLQQPCEVLGLDIHPVERRDYGFPFSSRVVNLLDAAVVAELLEDFRPTRVVHLASVSNVGVSWKNPLESFANNTTIFLNLLEGLRRSGISARVLSVGSSEEYGNVTPEDLPLIESRPPSPSSPYGVARVAQEMLSRVYVSGYGMDIVITRSFNHIGPGQRDQFVIPSFVKQLVLAKRAGLDRCVLQCGNTAVVRDFLDVRDVVEAYFLLLDSAQPGELYNVCSGEGRSLDQVLGLLAEILGMEIVLEPDPNLIRPNELLVIVGSPEKIQSQLGWRRRLEFAESLRDLVEYWQKTVEQEARRTDGQA